jgi:hypothetical protein
LTQYKLPIRLLVFDCSGHSIYILEMSAKEQTAGPTEDVDGKSAAPASQHVVDVGRGSGGAWCRVRDGGRGYLLGAWRASLRQVSVGPQSVPQGLSRVYASFESFQRP